MIDNTMPTAEAEAHEQEGLTVPTENAEQGIYTWQGHERTWLARGQSWYVYAGIAAVILLVYALFTQAWTMALVISLLAGVVYLYSQSQAPVLDIVISNKGLYVGADFYAFTYIKHFWFQFLPEEAYVCFQLVNSTKSRLVLSINPEERLILETTLREYLVVDDFHKESFAEKVERMF